MTTTSVVYDIIARDNASRTFRKVGDSTGRLQRGLGALAHAAKVAGVAVGAAAVVGGAVSVKMALDFQSSMTKVQTQAGASARDVKILSGEVLKLGKYAEQSPQELADSLYHLKSVGLDNAKAMKALREASDLAAVGGAGLEDTTNALAGAWRSGIRGAKSFHGAVSTLNAIIGAGNMRMEDLVGAMGTGFLPAAKSFGLSLKQVGAALALMTDEGIPAEAAATRLRMSFSLLGAPSITAEKQLKTIGLTGLDLAKAMRGPRGLIGAVGLLKDSIAKSGLTAAQTSQLLSRAFGGGRSSAAILTMINNFDVLRKKQTQINDSTGRFTKAVKTQRQTAQAQFDLLKSSVQVLAIRLGTTLLPMVTRFVRFIANTALPAVVGFGQALVHRFIPLDQMKSAVASASGMVSDFLAGIQGKSRSQSVMLGRGHIQLPSQMMLPQSTAAKLGRQVKDSLSGGLSGAVASIDWGKLGYQIATHVVDAIGTLGKFVGKIATKLDKALSGIDWVGIGIAVGKQVPALLIGLATGILDFDLLGLLKGLAEHWQSVLFAILTIAFLPAKIIGKVAEVLAKIPLAGPLLAWALRAFKSFSDTIVGLAGKALKALGRGFLDGFRDVFPGVGAGFGKWLELLPTRLGVIAIDLVQGAGRMLRRFGDTLGRGAIWPVRQIARLIALVLKAFYGIASWLLRPGIDLVKGLASGIAKYAAVPVKMLRQLGATIQGVFKRAFWWLVDSGWQLIQGLMTGIRNAMVHIGGFLKDHVWSPIVHGVKSLFGIHSPSTVFAGFGFQMIRGLIKGLVAGNPAEFARKVFGGVSDSARQALGWMVNHGLVAFDKLKGLGGAALSTIGGQLSKIGGLFSGGPSLTGAGAGFSVVLGKAMAGSMGWSGAQWNALYNLWQGESGWNPMARNPTSGAFGIPQALPASKMGSAAVGGDAAAQIRWGLGYIASRYGSPLAAYSAWLSRSPHWYDSGGVARGAGYLPKKTLAPERVLSPRQTTAFERMVDALAHGGQGGRVALTITNWRDGTGYIEQIADGRIDGRQAFRASMAGLHA